MNLNIILGSSGTLFVTVIAPGTIMNVFFKNQLGASSASLGLLVAALSVAQGGSKVEGAQAILLALAVSWLFANLGTSGWWRWMADLIPEDIRSTFFSRRSAIINGVTMIWFLLATVALDLFKNADIFSVYCELFAVGGLGACGRRCSTSSCPSLRPGSRGRLSDGPTS